MLEKKYIIGIFSIKYIKNTKEYKAIINDLTESKNLFDISDGDPKSFVLLEKGNEKKGYIIKFSVGTIMKRLDKEGR